jgi:Fe-S cluster assembly protein SufD
MPRSKKPQHKGAEAMTYSLAAPEQIASATGVRPAEPAWLTEARRDGLAQFTASGLPTQRVEAWKYTGLNSLKNMTFEIAANSTVTAPAALCVAQHRLVFVDGLFDPTQSDIAELSDGVHLSSLSQALTTIPDKVAAHFAVDGDQALPFPALNSALTTDGYVLILDDGVQLDGILEVTFISSGEANYPRILIVAGANSRATIVQHHVGNDASYLSNVVTKLDVGDNAEIAFYRLQSEGPAAHHISTVDAQLGENAKLNNFTLTLGAKLSRNEIHLGLNGRGSEAIVDGAYLLAGEQHGDTTGFIDHRAPETNSSQTYKGVLDDKAQGVFAGRIKVHPDAQRIEGNQLSRALLLSDDAAINTKPELQIHADDVKCSHGATAGELGEDGLFYLRSRGIPEHRARQMLIEAFVADGINAITEEQVRDGFAAQVSIWLEAHRQ